MPPTTKANLLGNNHLNISQMYAKRPGCREMQAALQSASAPKWLPGWRQKRPFLNPFFMPEAGHNRSRWVDVRRSDRSSMERRLWLRRGSHTSDVSVKMWVLHQIDVCIRGVA